MAILEVLRKPSDTVAPRYPIPHAILNRQTGIRILSDTKSRNSRWGGGSVRRSAGQWRIALQARCLRQNSHQKLWIDAASRVARFMIQSSNPTSLLTSFNN